MKPDRTLVPLLLALALSPLASAQESRGPDEPTCRNVNFPSSEERLVRACHAQFNFCANPPPAWQRLPQVMQVCAAIERERLLPRAAISGAPREPAIVNPPTVAIGPGGHAAALAGAWKLNGNGFVGDASVQQNADGTLMGSVYGDALTGYYAPGERIGVWLRLQGGRPIQAFVGQASADGASVAGRIYTLNATTSGGSAQRNLFAFAAQRGASAPPNPGLPPAAAGPANVSGTHAIVGNGFAGTLQLNQAPDGALSGSVYGQPIEGHYAAGSGTIAFIRYSAPGQPYQLFVGSVTPQGVQNGEFFALSANAGASAQRMRFGWTLQAMAPAVAVAPTQPPQNQLAPGASTIVSAGVILPPPRIEGWTLVRPPATFERSSRRIVSTQLCPPGKVVTGAAGNAALEGINLRLRIVGSVPLSDGSGWQTIAAKGSPVTDADDGVLVRIICIDRPEGYEVVQAAASVGAQRMLPAEANCPPNKVLIGGGSAGDERLLIFGSAPAAAGLSWQALLVLDSTQDPPPPTALGPARNELFASARDLLSVPAQGRVLAICVSSRLAAARRVVESGPINAGGGSPATGSFAGTSAAVVECGNTRSLAAGVASTAPGVVVQRLDYAEYRSAIPANWALRAPSTPARSNVWTAFFNAASAPVSAILRVICAEP